MIREVVDIKTIASRLRYSENYLRNKWPELLMGIRPVKLGANRALRFFWDDVEKLLLQPK
ncbi:MAG: hypothetical protein C4540_04750 [Candidatus Omnitrophota bacterium]|jgi:hypothetical protein|nr:MAG: hypothetical protein C4540_04750 [Candidatus Omnitrophota bacterium]